jgi:hypothetical protein
VTAECASAGRSSSNSPIPSAAPRSPLSAASTAASTLICPLVAPTSRSAANRSSRRAAASRVAVPIRMRIGNRNARAPTTNASRKYGDHTCLPGAVLIAVTATEVGSRASTEAGSPM